MKDKNLRPKTIKYKCSFNNVVLEVMKHRNWEESHALEESEFDIYWCDPNLMKEIFDQMYFEDHVRINHFRNHYELTRKNLLVKNLKRYSKYLERYDSKLESLKCNFFPTSFELPLEYHMFVECFKESKNSGQIWIMKPAAKSQGKGIFLFRRLKDIIDWKKSESYNSPCTHKQDNTELVPIETYVVQRYIQNPYLIGGKKFDLRIYVLVQSYNPLKVWLYRSGFARFSNTRYGNSEIDNKYVHLTNVAVQKLAPNYDPNCLKLSLQKLRDYLTAKHGYKIVNALYKNIDTIIIKSLQSVRKIIINDKHCFELYGYDILIDKDLKPWLIEVNASPSLTSSSQEDYTLKFGLLADVFNVVDMEGRFKSNELRIGGFDLIWNDGQVMLENTCSANYTSRIANSFIGCENDREEQIKQILSKCK
ncbi:putative tubulin polyglutamylase TTLL9 [Intoshia linei]|uniref:Tubulin--tyrosine ligase-like protein 9 n=1 Tax=Intoshia linei TaxID=1819745 RepID=A0A177B6V0_9BILA|nr:putative tubulin polyglutamylase TTLL9 [Intoshia linei]